MLRAAGASGPGDPLRTTGHAIEVRLNAEDPDNGFAASPGTIERFRILTGPGVRLETGVAEGDRVPPDFDSMIAKVIAFGQSRAVRLFPASSELYGRALSSSKVAPATRSFLLELLNRVARSKNRGS